MDSNKKESHCCGETVEGGFVKVIYILAFILYI